MLIELPAGAIVGGKYRVERLLGSGAVGMVYAAEHVETGKRVALKCVDASQAIDPAAAERLVREAQAAARIRHPNVVDIYDVGREGTLVFLVMEYLEGEPLTFMIARRDLPVHKLIALLLPAMRGVAEAHRQGVVHRDIKPENIFLARQLDVRDPMAKVLDFGISKLDARGRSLRSLTADGYAIGTPGYMAYEQAMGDKTLDGRADVYSFGAILYEALTGKVPHAAEDFPSLMRHFVAQRVTPPLELGAKIPHALSALVMWAIERDREQRVSSMESLIRELEPFAAESSYPREQGAAVARPARGRTMVGPWGLGKPSGLRATLRAASEPTSSRTAPTTIEAMLWLKRMRMQHARRAWLMLGLTLLALGLLGFSLRARPPLAAAARAPIPRVANAIKVSDPPPPAEPPRVPEAIAQPKIDSVPVAPKPTPSATVPAPVREASPAAPPKQKVVAKTRDFGIY